MARIVIATFGTYGDIHPYLGLAQALQARGHDPVMATSINYQEKIVSEGIEYAQLRPNPSDLGDVVATIQRANDFQRGTEILLQEILLPHLERTYRDLLHALDGADLLVNHLLVYAGPLAAETTAIPWLTGALYPIAFLSTEDPPLLAQAPWLRTLHAISPALYRVGFRLILRRVDKWAAPVHALRAKLGLQAATRNPLTYGAFSPYGTLALFSPLLAQPQPDWPHCTHLNGFVFFDREPVNVDVEPQLKQFLATYGPPLVFTLGTAAVYNAGDFYRICSQAARRLGRPAVLITGPDLANRPDILLHDTIVTFPYVPFSQLFPHALVNIHQGGIGTMAQAMRSGRPMLVIPFSHDQPDNGYRAQRLGIGRTLNRRDFTIENLVRALQPLIDLPCYAEAAAHVAEQVRQEDGAAAACAQIEQLLSKQKRVQYVNHVKVQHAGIHPMGQQNG
jgi:rhamnosyltransferase subunit B